MHVRQFISDYWHITLAVIVVSVATILYGAGAVATTTEFMALAITFIAFSVAEAVRQSTFRKDMVLRFASLSESMVIDNTASFFRILHDSTKKNTVLNIDVCYFTQTPPPRLYHLPTVKRYWTELPALLRNNAEKRLRRIVMVGSEEMLQWLEAHMAEHEGIPNYSLAVLVDRREDNAFISLCLTDDCECFLFSPHTAHESPSYIWIRNTGIYKSLLVAYERMWHKASVVMSGGVIIRATLDEVTKSLRVITH